MTEKKLRINQSEFNEWLQLPATKQYFDALVVQAERRKEYLAEGGCVRDHASDTGAEYIRVATMIDVYMGCSNPSWEDILNSIEEDDND